MAKDRRTKPEWQKDIAKERIEILFREAALQARAGNLKRATRYVYLARRIGMKYNARIPADLKRQFCHHCYVYFVPGKNVRIRTNPENKAVEYLCQECKKITRYPYVRERKAVKRRG